jgi:hypothetical protein
MKRPKREAKGAGAPPAWLQRGSLRWAPHEWEIPDQARRLGQAGEDWAAVYGQIHGEKFIGRLAALGANAVNTHFMRGLGLRAERAEIARLKRTVPLFHKHGIRVIAYTQAGSVMPEVIRDEIPKIADWVRRDVEGRPIPYGVQYWRWFPCWNNPKVRAYLKRCVGVALKEVGADGVFFDNFYYGTHACFGPSASQGAITEVCHCRHCQAAFRRFLEERWPDARGAFGLPHYRHVRISPHFLGRTDPMRFAWLCFRDHVTERTLRELHIHAKSLNPQAAVCANNILWFSMDLKSLFRWGEMSTPESRDFPGMEGKSLVNQVLFLKLGTALGRTIVPLAYYRHRASAVRGFVHPEGDVPKSEALRLQMAEPMAFGGHAPVWYWQGLLDAPAGHVVRDPGGRLDAVAEMMDFFRYHQRLYKGSQPAARTALVHSHRSLKLDPGRVGRSFQGMLQTLLQNHHPFEIAFLEHEEDWSRFDLVILTDVISVGEGEAERLRAFVRKGGRLLATGRTSLFNEMGRQRRNYLLADLFGMSVDEAVSVRTASFRKLGKGRMVFTPATPEFCEPIVKSVLGKGTYPLPQLPLGEMEILRHLSALLGSDERLETNAPKWVLLDLHRSATGALLVHLLSYDPVHPTARIRIRLPANLGRFHSVRFLQPGASSRDLRPSRIASGTAVTVTGPRPYGIIEFTH